MLSFFSQKKLIGLDIGSSTIKIAEVDVSRKSNTLLGFGVIPTPAGSFSSGDISNEQAIADAIRQLLMELKTKRKNAATGVSGTSVIVKRITIPKIEQKLIAEQIRWEAEQYIPYDINEVNLDFQVLSKSSSAENMDLLLVAAVQGHIFKYSAAVQLAGLNCSIIDVSGFALANCFKTNYGNMEGQSVALLDVGSSSTTMVVLENSEVVFCRDIPVGGQTYTLDLQKTLNIQYEEAEALKLSMGSGGKVPEEAMSVIQATHEVIAEEIKGSYDFFLNSSKSQTITRTFVTGGGIRMKGLIEALSKINPCEKLNPFFNLTLSPKTFSAQYIEQIKDLSATAIGLGLRKVGD